ncbi:MAG: glycosyltransferase family 4 protein, partial [Chthoniobacterales bacterium]
FRAAFGIQPDALVVGCIGRIKLRRKGQEYVIQAAHLLKQRGLIARYLIVGSPYTGNEDHVEELKKLTRNLDLDEEIIFTGELEDPKPAYAAMDIFVLPSAQPEPFGGVVMEAMAMSLPVIATNIGGSLDQVAENETGFLISPADATGLAAKIELLARDAALRERMGLASRERIRTTFNLEKMAREIESAYESSFRKWKTR